MPCFNPGSVIYPLRNTQPMTVTTAMTTTAKINNSLELRCNFIQQDSKG